MVTRRLIVLESDPLIHRWLQVSAHLPLFQVADIRTAVKGGMIRAMKTTEAISGSVTAANFPDLDLYVDLPVYTTSMTP